MRRKIFIFCAMALAASQSYAKLETVFASNKFTAYLDTNSVQSNGKLISYILVANFAERDEKGAKSQVYKYEMNCSNGTFRPIKGTNYDGEDGSGNVTQNLNPSDRNWENNNKIMQFVSTKICANQQNASGRTQAQQPTAPRAAPANSQQAMENSCARAINERLNRTRSDQYGNTTSKQVTQINYVTTHGAGMHGYGQNNNMIHTAVVDTVKNGQIQGRDIVQLDCVVSPAGQVLGVEIKR